MRQRRSHAPSKATPSSMSAKLRDDQLSIYSIFFEDVWWSLNETTVCSERAEWSTWKLELSCWLSSWREIQSTLELCDKTLGGSLCPSLLMTMGSKIVEDFATAFTQTAVFISFIFSLLDWGTSWASCTSDSSNIHANQKESNKSAVSGGLTTI